ncbi:MAG: HEPN domain-containing protein [Candidatus Altiarchaeales archaeon]|nr:HEPN domain-containing protein [Candidatus Altiarchaeales archaeon]
MREDVLNWWEQALRDMETAEILLKNDRLDAAAFYCQQSIEKALKAYIIKSKRESPASVHSLVRLAKDAGVPGKYFPFLRNLTPEYYVSRYPDAIEDVPYKVYDAEDVTSKIKSGREFLRWIESQIKK